MLASDVEYIALRVIRKFIFRDALLMRIGRWLPYYQANLGMDAPDRIIGGWIEALGGEASIAGKRVLELGSGSTNSGAYAVAGAGAASVCALEPFRAFEPRADAAARRYVAGRKGLPEAELSARVERVTSIAAVPDASIDLVVSHSVLEHLTEPETVLKELDRVLAPGGVMCHAIDFRDHFFKYPFHFLKFGKSTWSRWLDPGDLPRWRLSDYLCLFERLGYTTSVPMKSVDADGYAAIRGLVSPDFDADDPTMPVTLATVLATRKADSASVPAAQ